MTTDAGQIVSEEGRGLRGYFTSVPNIVIDDERIGPFEMALYLHYRRVAGDGGVCFQGRAQLEKATRIGYTRLLEARAKLVEWGYLRVTERGAPRPTEVEIVDVWGENFAKYRPPRTTRATDGGIVRHASDPGGIVRHASDIDRVAGDNRSPRETEEDPSKKIPLRSEIRRAGAELSLIGNLVERLEAAGMHPDSADQLFELLNARGYDARDQQWIVEQGLERGAKALAYYREIAASNAPGIVARLEAARRRRGRGNTPTAPAPRVGAPASGSMPIPPTLDGGAE